MDPFQMTLRGVAWSFSHDQVTFTDTWRTPVPHDGKTYTIVDSIVVVYVFVEDEVGTHVAHRFDTWRDAMTAVLGAIHP